MLLIVADSKSMHQSNSRILQEFAKSSFLSVERNYSYSSCKSIDAKESLDDFSALNATDNSIQVSAHTGNVSYASLNAHFFLASRGAALATDHESSRISLRSVARICTR